MDPDMDLTEELKMRSGTGLEGSSLRNGAMVTLMEPETVLRRISAGVFAVNARWGIIVILIEPDMVLMERRS